MILARFFILTGLWVPCSKKRCALGRRFARGLKPSTDVIYMTSTRRILARCDIIKTNTFGLSRLVFPKEGKMEEIAKAAVGIARRAGDKMVAIDIGPTESFTPYGDLKFEEAVSILARL